MEKNKIDNVKLGLFVAAGVLFMVFSLYMIGRNRNLFGATFKVSAIFYQVDGLTAGNNVRYAGIDVGTVSDIEIESDSTIRVTMLLSNNVKKHLKSNAIATIGTDGLIGNKLINISARSGAAMLLEEGDVLNTLHPIETDAMLRTLNTTNQNIERITHNLKSITEKLDHSNNLWSLLSDKGMAQDLVQAAAMVRASSVNIHIITQQAIDWMEASKNGNGLVGSLVNDTLLFLQLQAVTNDLQIISTHTKKIVRNADSVMLQIKTGKGTARTLLYDTVFTQQLSTSMNQIQQGTARFNQSMEALQHNFLLRNYFKKKAKKSAKSKADNR